VTYSWPRLRRAHIRAERPQTDASPNPPRRGVRVHRATITLPSRVTLVTRPHHRGGTT